MSRPTVLLGEFTGRRVPRLQASGWGRMWIMRRPTPYPGEPWGFDNGAFRDWVRGKEFDADAYQRRLLRAYNLGRPRLAIAPDIVTGGLRSLEFSMDWIDGGRLPRDWPWYLAVQDGMATADVSGVAGEFEGVFLGGSTPFKATAGTWCAFAHANGLRFHYARAGTLDRLLHACEIGADSLDSAFPMWTEARWRTFERWWRDGDPRTPMDLDAAGGDS